MRKTTNIVMFLLLLNASAALVGASGVGADWGIDPNPGGGAQVDAANQTAADGFSAGQGEGSTLFTLYSAATGTVEAIFSLAFAAPTMFGNLGVPGWLNTFLFAPMYVIVGLEIFYAWTGRDL